MIRILASRTTIRAIAKETYHHIDVLGKSATETDVRVDVVGSLCENNNKFAIQRTLPNIEMGDILCIHDI